MILTFFPLLTCISPPKCLTLCPQMQTKLVISFFVLFMVGSNVFSSPQTPLEVILQRTMSAAEQHNRLVESFEAELYTRSYVNTVRRNFLYRYTHLVPRFALHDPNHSEAFIETLGTLWFEYPNNYALDINHVNGTLTSRIDIESIPFSLFNLNIYSETTYDEGFFMPTRFNTARYYTFTLGETFVDNDVVYYVIHFSPLFTNTRLLSGHFIVESDSWRITFFRGEGPAIFSNFSFEITMGSGMVVDFLPESFVIHQTISYLGNVIETVHLAHLTYTDIVLRYVLEPDRSLNISDFYRVRIDSVPVYSNPEFWLLRRPIPLSYRGWSILERFHERESQNLSHLSESDETIPGVGQFAQRMVMNAHFTNRVGTVHYSGLLNPLMISYSTYDGVTYRQRLNLNFRLRRERSINVNAFVGYIFNRREFFSDVTTTWNYNPMQMGSVTLSFGNRTPSFSSLFLDQVQDSLRQFGLTFEDIALPYFRNYYLRLFNTYEITNGLLINAGFEYHIRTGIRNEHTILPPQLPDNGDYIENWFSTRRSLMPFVRISWTPEQFYRFQGRQKIPVRSRFPTFKLEVARSFQDFLWSTSEYNRLEFNINHSVPIRLMRSLNYQVGAGMFTNQRTEYFADFSFFARNNFPESWNDGLGGVFNLLSRPMFHASDSYVQAHLMYETPFFLLSHIPFVSNFAAKERIYLSQLYTPQIVSYSEIGYGFGNRFFSTAVFAAFHRTDFQRLGARLVFEF